MEELLASIRKAIQDDIGEIPPAPQLGGRPVAGAPAHNAPPSSSSVAGSMRESRVRVSDALNSASEEISGLRNRIQRNRAAEALARNINEQQAGARQMAASSRPGPFTSALTGAPESSNWRRPLPEPEPAPPPLRHELPAVLPEPPPMFRPSYAERDTSTVESHRASPPYGRFGREMESLQRPTHTTWREPLREPPALPPPEPEPAPYQTHDPGHGAERYDAPMLSDGATQAASSAFNRLAESFLSRALGERPIEDMARDMLRTMLKQWLDENLPPLVERLVREEIERVARRSGR